MTAAVAATADTAVSADAWNGLEILIDAGVSWRNDSSGLGGGRPPERSKHHGQEQDSAHLT